MKKWLAVAVCAIMALSCVGFAACGDKEKKDGTASGAAIAMPTVVSQQTYATAKKAAYAYVLNELFGGGEDYEDMEEEDPYLCKITAFDSLGEVQTDTVGLSQAQQADITKVEKYSLQIQYGYNYIYEDYGTYNFTVTQPVHIATVDDEFCYLVTTPAMGEHATRSYLEYLFRYDAFKNCKVRIDAYEIEDVGHKKPEYFEYTTKVTENFSETALYGTYYKKDENTEKVSQFEQYAFVQDNTPVFPRRDKGADSVWQMQNTNRKEGTLKDFICGDNAFATFNEDRAFDFVEDRGFFSAPRYGDMESCVDKDNMPLFGWSLDFYDCGYFSPIELYMTKWGLSTSDTTSTKDTVKSRFIQANKKYYEFLQNEDEYYEEDVRIREDKITLIFSGDHIAKIQVWMIRSNSFAVFTEYVFSDYGNVSVTVPEEVKSVAAASTVTTD